MYARPTNLHPRSAAAKRARVESLAHAQVDDEEEEDVVEDMEVDGVECGAEEGEEEDAEDAEDSDLEEDSEVSEVDEEEEIEEDGDCLR